MSMLLKVRLLLCYGRLASPFLAHHSSLLPQMSLGQSLTRSSGSGNLILLLVLNKGCIIAFPASDAAAAAAAPFAMMAARMDIHSIDGIR
jgi:hypothetical protein